MKVLFIDDTVDNLNLFKIYMKNFDEAECTFESDPKKGIEYILKDSFDIIFLDIEMPEVDGFQVLDNIGSVKIPIFALTAHLSGEIINRIKEHTMISGVVHKPVLKKNLIEIIKNEAS